MHRNLARAARRQRHGGAAHEVEVQAQGKSMKKLFQVCHQQPKHDIEDDSEDGIDSTITLWNAVLTIMAAATVGKPLLLAVRQAHSRP